MLLGLLLPIATSAQGGQLDGLEMDVLGPGELPGASMPRIALPDPIGRDERLPLGLGERSARQDLQLRLEASDAALESSSALADSDPPRPPMPPPLETAPNAPELP